MSPSAAAPHPHAGSPRTAPGCCPAKLLDIGKYVPFIPFFFILLDLFVAFATCVLLARLVYKAFASIYKSVYKAPRPGVSAFPVDPTRADSCDMSQPYAHRAEIERLDQRSGSTSGSTARVPQLPLRRGDENGLPMCWSHQHRR